MAGPITWRNIDAPSLNGVGSLFRGAQDSFNQGMGSLGKLLDTAQQTRVDNVNALRNSNQQDFRSYMSSFLTPEDLEAAQTSGALADRLAGYGGAIDRAAADDLVNTQISQLRSRIRDQNQYADEKRDREERPLQDEILSMITQGNTEGARARLDELQLRSEHPLEQALANALRTQKQDKRDDTRFSWESNNQAFTRDTQNRELQQRQEDALSNKLIGELANTPGTEADLREILVPRLTEQGVSGPGIARALQNLSGTYGAARGLTAEQSEAAIQQGALAKTLLDRKLAQYPVTRVFSFNEPEAVTQGDAIEYAKTLSPDDQETTVENVRGAVADYEKNFADLIKKNNLPVGALAQEAIKRVGTTSWAIFDTPDVPKNLVYQEMQKIADEYILSLDNARIVDEAQRDYINKTSSAVRSKLKDSLKPK